MMTTDGICAFQIVSLRRLGNQEVVALVLYAPIHSGRPEQEA